MHARLKKGNNNMSKKQSTILVTTFILIAAVAVVIWGGERKQPEQPSPAGNGGDVVSQDSNIPQNREDIDTNDNDNDPISISDEDPIVITSDIDTSDWKTYRNEELGFELVIPDNWYINGSYKNENEQRIHLSPGKLGPNNDFGIFVEIIKKTDNQLSYYESINEVIKNWKYKPILLSKVVLDDKELLQLGALTFFENKDRVFVTNFVPAGEISIETYNAFLLSFNTFDVELDDIVLGDNDKIESVFVNIDTSDWKTYRNEELGFEIKYPAEWYENINLNNDIFIFRPTEDPVEAPTVSLSKIQENKTISNYEKRVDEYMKNTFMIKKWIIVDGEKFIQYQSPFSRQRLTFVNIKNDLFVLSLNSIDSISLDTYNSILALMSYK